MSSNIPKLSVSVSELKKRYLELISSGYVENVALRELSFPSELYIKCLVEDPDFAVQVEAARKMRAEFWVEKIVKDIDYIPSKDDVGGERLKFDKLQFLAKADNPERYGNNNKKLDINIDISQFKLLPPEEAMKSLKNDPFAVEADFIEVDETPEDGSDLL